jgi:hypothetical protein
MDCDESIYPPADMSAAFRFDSLFCFFLFLFLVQLVGASGLVWKGFTLCSLLCNSIEMTRAAKKLLPTSLDYSNEASFSMIIASPPHDYLLSLWDHRFLQNNSTLIEMPGSHTYAASMTAPCNYDGRKFS